LLLLNLRAFSERLREAVTVLDLHHDEIEVLHAHQALQWLVHRIDWLQKWPLTPRECDLRTVRPNRIKVGRPYGTQNQVVDTLAT